jgi:hypothetical protein
VRTKNAAHGQNRLKSADFKKRNTVVPGAPHPVVGASTKIASKI